MLPQPFAELDIGDEGAGAVVVGELETDGEAVHHLRGALGEHLDGRIAEAAEKLTQTGFGHYGWHLEALGELALQLSDFRR